MSSRSTCLRQADTDGTMTRCFVVIEKAVHVAETTGLKVHQIFSFLLLNTSGLNKEMAFLQVGVLSPWTLSYQMSLATP